MIDLIVPLIIVAVAVTAMVKKVDVFSSMVKGAGEGVSTMLRIFPTLVTMLTAVYMLRASGALDYIIGICSPALNWLGIPPEVAPIMLIRPISGSAALAVASEIIYTYGPDSAIGLTAAIMLGSTETTFYIISVYFGAAGISKTRYAIPAALIADLTGFVVAAFSVKLLF